MRDESRRALWMATVLGTVLQVSMVLVGHFESGVAALFGPLGMAISLVAGVLYGIWASPAGGGEAAGGGAVAGGMCALIGIAISFALGDVTAILLLLGTASSAVAGALGGPLGRLMGRRRLAA